MTFIKTLTIAGAITLAAAAAVPSFAAAHGAVYETDALVVDAGAPSGFSTQTRYVVANHGYVYVLRETNGRTSRGMLNYPKAPGALRQTPGYDIFTNTVPVSADTGAQPHATCDVPSLNAGAAKRAWQDADPFYAYVPFQQRSAGLEDDPDRWIPVVKETTGIDLRAVGDSDAARQTACGSIGGTYYPADEIQSSNASFNSGLIADTKAPLEASISTLQARLATSEAAKATAEGAATANAARATAAEQRATAAEAKLAAAPIAKPLAATLSKRTLTPRGLASSGLRVAVTGPAGQKVTVRVTVSAAQAKQRKLPSTTLGARRVTVGANGSATVTVKPSAAVGRTLRAIRTGRVPVTVELVAATARATVAR